MRAVHFAVDVPAAVRLPLPVDVDLGDFFVVMMPLLFSSPAMEVEGCGGSSGPRLPANTRPAPKRETARNGNKVTNFHGNLLFDLS